MQKDSFQEFSVDLPVYDSYSSKNVDSIADSQEGWPIYKLVEKDQQRVFLKKSMSEELKNVCDCPDQEDIYQQTPHEKKAAANLAR